MRARTTAALLALALGACWSGPLAEDAADLDAGATDDGGSRRTDACWAPRTLPPRECTEPVQVGCPCPTELEIQCAPSGGFSIVCIDGIWEGDLSSTPGCTPGSCRSTPMRPGCPCCGFREICLGIGEGIGCYGDRWSRFFDGPCWPMSDTGPPWWPDAGTDASEPDADLDAATDDASEPDAG